MTNHIVIEGLDTNRGVYLSGGKLGYYYEVLAAFHEDGLEKINTIKECLENGDLPLYKIHVHALKSALANIGADSLSEKAFALEKAAQRQDLSFIEAKNGQFLVLLERFLGDIINALSMQEGLNGNKADDLNKAEMFKTGLEKLKTALDAMDAGIINRTVDELLDLAYSDEVKTVVRKISKHILLAEFDEAVVLADTL